jgi:hypothetical protein
MASILSQSAHALIGQIGGAVMHSTAPFIRALRLLATVDGLGSFQVGATRQVALIITSSLFPWIGRAVKGGSNAYSSMVNVSQLLYRH